MRLNLLLHSEIIPVFGGSQIQLASGPIAFIQAPINILFRPFPWEVGGVLQIITFFEIYFIWFLVIKNWKSFRRAIMAIRKDRLVAFSVVFIALFSIGAGLALSNLGLIARQRIVLYPFFLILIYAYSDKRIFFLKKRRQARMAALKMAKVLIIAGYASSLYNFRGPLIKTLLEKHEVVTTAPFDSDEVSRNIKALGVEYYPNKFERTGLNPLADIYAARDLTKLIKRIKPDCVLAYTIKPVIFGLRAAQKVGIKRTFALVTGLGSGFDQGTRKQSLISKVVKRLYRRTLRRVSGVIFQNPDDQNFFFDERIIGYSKPSVVVNGSGVDLSHYQADLAIQ